MPPSSPRFAVRRAIGMVLLATTGLAPVTVAAASPAAHASRTVGAIDGPDVASYQHPGGHRISWRLVRRAHKEFAIVKATEGTAYRNPWFRRDYVGARRAGLVRGSYHFARPGYPVVSSAKRQARFYVAHLNHTVRTRKTLPPALDLETTGGLGRAALVTWAQTFLLETRRLTHRTPMIYTYPYFWSSSISDPAAFAPYRLWMASYDGRPAVPASLWQYTSTARVNGIRGSVDMSRFTGDAETWRVLSNGRLRDPWKSRRPGAPQHVHVTVQHGHAVVHWLPGDAGSKGISSYVVRTSRDATPVRVSGSTFAVPLPDFVRGTTGTLNVRARNAVGAGPSSRLSFVVPLLRARLTIRAPAPIFFGADAAFRVRLTTAGGSPLADRKLQIAGRLLGSEDWLPLATTVTGPRGWATIRLTEPAHSVEIQLTFAHSGWETAQAGTRQLVRTAVTLTSDLDSSTLGQPVTLSGTVGPAIGGTPVRVQELVGDVWHSFAWLTSQEDGTFIATVLPAALGTHVYRAVADPYDGRERGTSATITLVVS